MKKICYLMGLLLALVVSGITFVSCSDDEELSPLKTIPKGVKAVDLGLPSGTLWANMNVGAIKEEGFGYYFAWGETESKPRSDYDWGTYKWCNGSNTTMTKYCTRSDYGYNGFIDNKMELDPEDDAAFVNWGKEWRMPTYEQLKELRDQCSWTWKTINNVKGYLVEGKNGNAIFLPAAGQRSKNGSDNAGLLGCYWLRTLYASGRSARGLYFDSGDVSMNGYSYRFFGRSVRPVRATE